MKRAAIYARFSSDRQNDRSNADQIALARAWCAGQNYAVIAIYEDSAASGASIAGRPDMQRLLMDARTGHFDIVVADSLSRIGRDEEDRAAIRKRLTFHGIAMATPVDGIVTRLIDGIRAVMDGNYLDDLRHATRRGMAGVVRQGRSAGGRAYGYRAVHGEAGKLMIADDEALIVREIFTRYAANETPRAIAADLNRRGIKAPRGRQWHASTINGNAKRGNGIVQNELYVGRLVWNKIAMVKNPDTGKRVSRPNPREQWQRHDTPELAIVTSMQFDAAQRMKQYRSHVIPALQRSPRRMLSGLLRCASCGGGMSIYSKQAGGQARVRCTTHAEGGICPAPHSFNLATIETATVAALRKEFQKPDEIAIYIREYHAERKRLAGSSTKRRGEIERRSAEIERTIQRATDALLSGTGDATAITARCKALRAEQSAIIAELTALPDNADVVALHPTVLARYEVQMTRLAKNIGKSVAAGDVEAIAAIRDLVASVTVRPGPKYGTVAIEIAGRLDRLLHIDTNLHRKVVGSMVAGGRLTRTRHPERLFLVCRAG